MTRPTPNIALTLPIVFAGFIIAAEARAAAPVEGPRNMRGAVVQGADGTALSAYICGDFNVWGTTSLVGCGAASDIFEVDAGHAELSHYRLEYEIGRVRAAESSFGFHVGAGMAEGQLGVDAPGFFFDPNPARSTVEAAGPELVGAFDAELPTVFEGYSWRFRMDVGVAWLPGWKEVGGTSNDVVPFAVLTANTYF